MAESRTGPKERLERTAEKRGRLAAGRWALERES